MFHSSLHDFQVVVAFVEKHGIKGKCDVLTLTLPTAVEGVEGVEGIRVSIYDYHGKTYLSDSRTLAQIPADRRRSFLLPLQFAPAAEGAIAYTNEDASKVISALAEKFRTNPEVFICRT